MASSALSDELILATRWIAYGVFLLAALIVAQALVLRLVAHLRAYLTQRLRARWKAIFLATIEDRPLAWPRFSARDWVPLFEFWYVHYERAPNAAQERLLALIKQLQLGEIAARHLAKGTFRERLLATTIVGLLQDRSCWNLLVSMTKEHHPVLSLVALRALLHINTRSALQSVGSLLAERQDWPMSRLSRVLQEAEPSALCRVVKDLLRSAKRHELPRLIRFLEFLTCQDSFGMLREIVRQQRDSHVAAAILHACRDPTTLAIVRYYAAHPVWYVRVQVALALGRMALPEDRRWLLRLLGDEEWWVRYRAAHALVDVGFIKNEELHAIARSHQDRYARAMMLHVMAERGIP